MRGGVRFRFLLTFSSSSKPKQTEKTVKENRVICAIQRYGEVGGQALTVVQCVEEAVGGAGGEYLPPAIQLFVYHILEEEGVRRPGNARGSK